MCSSLGKQTTRHTNQKQHKRGSAPPINLPSLLLAKATVFVAITEYDVNRSRDRVCKQHQCFFCLVENLAPPPFTNATMLGVSSLNHSHAAERRQRQVCSAGPTEPGVCGSFPVPIANPQLTTALLTHLMFPRMNRARRVTCLHFCLEIAH